MQVCIPYESLVPKEVRNKCQVLWNWSFKWLWVTMRYLESNPGPLWEQQVLLTTETSLQTPRNTIFKCKDAGMERVFENIQEYSDVHTVTWPAVLMWILDRGQTPLEFAFPWPPAQFARPMRYGSHRCWWITPIALSNVLPLPLGLQGQKRCITCYKGQDDSG